MKISLKKSIVIIAALILLASLFYFILPPEREGTDKTGSSAEIDYGSLGQVVFKVKAAKVKRKDLVLSVNANGVVKANREISVVSNLNGTITALNVYEGKKVNSGSPLVKLDDREYILALKESEAALLDAKVEYALQNKRSPIIYANTSLADSLKREIRKLEDMFDEGYIASEQYKKLKEQLELQYILTGIKRKEVLKIRSGFTKALNNIKRAKLNLEYTQIKAPFGGVIAGADLSVGQRISSGTELFKLVDVSELKIRTGVLESEATRINKNAAVKIYISSFPAEVFNGYVKFVSPIVNPESKTCKVIIAFKDNGHKVKPGMYAELSIEVKRLKDRLLVPKQALLVRDSRNLIFMAEDSLAKWNYVDIGEQNEEFVEIIKGKNQSVKEGDLVLVEGQFTLDHDAKINVVDIIE